ncbi:flagellar biosynthesis protein FlhB [Endozoicomonas sp. Mp262]|uniref:flagellar biosynthesis protein FlhB n=1 Tax=Endozoicomonas sp. Mp262 TaxID=2919499 RepID=UPI0021D85D5C
MAENNQQGQEKTEEPTEKRLRDARRKGQLPRSRELVTVVMLLGGGLALILTGSYMANRFSQVARAAFSAPREMLLDESIMAGYLANSVSEGFLALIPFFSFILLAIILSSLALGGWVITGEPLLPKAERVSLIKGLKRMFSAKTLIELLKSVLKVVLIAGIMILAISYFYKEVLSLSRLPLKSAVSDSLTILSIAVLSLGGALVVVSLIDVPFQSWDHRQKLKMTRQEVKDEMKETEGNPEVKSRLRELQKELANQRMMDGVPDSDVIITNPTHFAVALKYDLDRAKAPFVVAKGTEQTALKICEIARAHNLPILQSPALTRAVYYSTKINQEVATELYVAVAQVLAYVHQLNEFKAGRSHYPEKPATPEIPEKFQR